MLNILQNRYCQALKKISELESNIKKLEQKLTEQKSSPEVGLVELVDEIKRLKSSSLNFDDILKTINDGINKTNQQINQNREELWQRDKEFLDFFSDKEGGYLKEIVDLIKKLLKLREELKQEQDVDKIKGTLEKIKQLEAKIVNLYQSLSEGISAKRDQLDKEKELCVKMIDEIPFMERLGNFIRGDKVLKREKLEEILSFQEVISRENDSDDGLLNYKLRELLGISRNKQVAIKVKDLCRIKKELTKLELQFKNSDRITKIFNVDMRSYHGKFAGWQVDHSNLGAVGDHSQGAIEYSSQIEPVWK